MEQAGHLRIIKLADRTIHLVGTAHVSRESVDEVREAIERVRPDAVVVELDANRLEAMTDEERWKRLDIFQVIRQRKVPFLLASLALASYQERIGAKLGVRPGAELLAAVDAARAVGAELVLGDRDVQVTLRRTWRSVSFLDRIRLLGALFGGFFQGVEITDETIEELKRGETLEDMLREFAEQFPAVKRPLIDERDAWLASSIMEAPGRTIVAVVGAAHVPGIVGLIGTPVDREELGSVPPGSRWVRLLKWVIPALVIGAFYIGYRRHAGEGLAEMTLAWLIPNSVLAALFSLIAGARMLSVLTAFVASPITSLNPTIAAGMVVGLVEAWLRRPTVADCQRIREDAQTLRGFYRNRFLRVLLVSALASLGSALGGWVGATWVVTLLGH